MGPALVQRKDLAGNAQRSSALAPGGIEHFCQVDITVVHAHCDSRRSGKVWQDILSVLLNVLQQAESSETPAVPRYLPSLCRTHCRAHPPV